MNVDGPVRQRPRARLAVYYDEGCGPCTTVAVWLDRLNWFGWVQFAPAATFPSGQGEEYVDIHGVHDAGAIYRGYSTYQQIAWRIPLLWILAPLLYVPPIPQIGRRIYRRVADARACQVDTTP